ncbi:unnamed protein product [Spirodela intermedia]|uniref:Uncharacterized protein n=1 Tax=Spirodela intermedia TaxID=51605 RepID=A0A7I8L283_SPIIN|nr:unnamed protein product [Spirodela intermedia]
MENTKPVSNSCTFSTIKNSPTEPVDVACQMMHNPTQEGWIKVKHLLRYFKGTVMKGLQFHKSSDFSLSIFSNVVWAGSPIDRRSTSGFLIFLGKNLISWS